MGKAQDSTLREVDEQVIAAKRLYSWDHDGIKARGDFQRTWVSHHFTEKETEA